MEVIRDEPEDFFLAFIEYARSVLSLEAEDSKGDGNGVGDEPTGPGWSWIVDRMLKTCIAYSSGVTAAILLSDLFQAWHEQNRTVASKRRPECVKRLVKNHPRPKLPSTVTIDSIYDKNFLSLSSVLEAVIVDAFVLPGTNIYMLSLGDFWSSNTIDLFLHRRYYDLVNPQNGILKKGREIFLTGCHLRTAAEGSGHSRLLPTEYLVILLDEEQDDDAMLLGAQFCSDSFSSVSMDAVNCGTSYSLYARIESIGPLEIQGDMNSLRKKQIILVDNDGFKLKFLLWGEQVALANLFSVGSMVALDRPYISKLSAESTLESMDELCLEYGSVTQLYLVPFIPHGEHVSITLSQSRCQGSRMLPTVDPSQDAPAVSQVVLPCDSQGSVDFTHYPFRPFVVDLRDKMTGISLYGVITEMYREENSSDVVFCLRIEDTSGAVCAKLHFCNFWTLKRLNLGHTVYISGLTCSATKTKCLELEWYESNPGASLVNISSLPAILNSPCLRYWSSLSELSAGSRNSSTYICRVWIDQIEHCQVDTRYAHTRCGHFVRRSHCVSEDRGVSLDCSFCGEKRVSEVSSAFYLRVVLSDEVGAGRVLAWCMGQTATELLQISPDEFSNLPEDEQLMYPSSLEKEKFVVALVNSRKPQNDEDDRFGVATQGDGALLLWEITCALKSN